ncbi:MAG TPA: YceI family protein, partial [Rhizobacter sp.]|nr:YceI family protein [Rhizobacter sp.]
MKLALSFFLPSSRAWLVIALLACAAGSARAEPARYELDPNHLSIGFLVEHIGYAKVQGMFRTARGSYRFDEATGALSEVRVEVDTASVFSNHTKRDEHLKGPAFLNTAEQPKMVFTATGAKRTGERTFEIAGQLQLIGKTQPLT